MEPEQLDVYDVLDLIEEEEHAGVRAPLQPCPECPDPALCQSLDECSRS